jgi:hypothetical protein
MRFYSTLIFIVCSFCLVSHLNAQSNYCGTPSNSMAIPQFSLKVNTLGGEINKPMKKGKATSLPFEVYTYYVQFVAFEAQGQHFDKDFFQEKLDEINKPFAKARVQFKMINAPIYSTDATFLNMEMLKEEALCQKYGRKNCINIFCMPTVLADDKAADAYTYLPQDSTLKPYQRNMILISNDAVHWRMN